MTESFCGTKKDLHKQTDVIQNPLGRDHQQAINTYTFKIIYVTFANSGDGYRNVQTTKTQP